MDHTGRCPIFIMVGKNNLTGIKIGELDIRRGCANGQYILEKNNIKETGYGIDDVVGVRVDVSDDILLASCWTEIPLDSDPEKTPVLGGYTQANKIYNWSFKNFNQSYKQMP